MAQNAVNPEDLVKVFVRTFDKKAKSIKFPQKIASNELK